MKKILLFLLAVMLAVPGMASAADRLPEGFIAMSESFMNWTDAVAWCEQQGGRLPRVNGSERFSSLSVPRGTLIDGFGAVGAPWPTGLPNFYYWTGTVHADRPNLSWYVCNFAANGKADTFPDCQSTRNWVVCVP